MLGTELWCSTGVVHVLLTAEPISAAHNMAFLMNHPMVEANQILIVTLGVQEHKPPGPHCGGRTVSSV